MKRLTCTIWLMVSLQTLADPTANVSYSPSITPDRFDERSRYLEAINLIRTSQFSRYYKLKPQLPEEMLRRPE